MTDAHQVKIVSERSRDVAGTVDHENFYRGANLSFDGRPVFLNLGKRNWEQVVLDPDTKKDIKSNTVDFLRRSKKLEAMEVTARRGVLLCGSPGTGKTIICKALMNGAKGITCITTNAYLLDKDAYVDDIYALAKDLKPSIVIIEDIDLVVQSRSVFHWMQASPLNSLLEALDGLEEQSGIVTVATTNCLEALD